MTRAFLAALFATAAALAQTAPPHVSYVASIKVNNSVDARGFSEYSPGGRLAATAITVAQLIRNAYRIQPYQLLGAPAWLSTRRYDVAAKADGPPYPTQQALVRALLEDRFHLAARNEPRDMPIFALVLARREAKPEGKLGPQLTGSSFDCAALLAGPHAPPEPGRTPNCATRIGPGTLSGKAISMAQLAAGLSPFAGRFTVDQTGLSGVFDVELTWTPEQTPSPDASQAPSGASIFTALQEQLGLKLTNDRGSVPVLVIDHIEEPKESDQ